VLALKFRSYLIVDIFTLAFLKCINNFINIGNSFKFTVPGKPRSRGFCVQGVHAYMYVSVAGLWIQIPLGQN